MDAQIAASNPFRDRCVYGTLHAVTSRPQSVPMPADDFGEKEFYLDEFHSHTLCFAVSLRE